MKYLVDPRGDIIMNILEANEEWYWATFWKRQHGNKDSLPSKIPPDWIANLKELGYACKTLKEEKE